MGQPTISIICPVYKAELYLKRCVDSILAQTFENWELILVDDGSPDKSGELCDNLTKGDRRIKVIHKINGGVGSARQKGLENVSGDFIIHIDPDDWIECNMLEELYKLAMSSNSDMVICDFVYDYASKSTISEQKPTNIADNNCIIDDILFQKVHGSCCNKLVRTSAARKCNATFYEGLNYCEDVIFNIQLLKTTIKVSYLNKAFYHYDQTINTNSLTSRVSKNHLLQYQLYCKYLMTLIGNHETVTNLKMDIKKYALCNGLVSKYEILQMYPEIKEVNSTFCIDRFFYNLGFKGYVKICKPYFAIRIRALSAINFKKIR